MEHLQKQVSNVLFPDAIRGYGVPRPYTHFETTPGNETSFWTMPSNVKTITPEQVKESLETSAYLAPDRPAAIGNETDISLFEATNGHLPEDLYQGILSHLHQDVGFDKFFREQVDCSGKYEDDFIYQGEHYDGKGARQIAHNFEQQGLYVLAHEIYQQSGTVCNQEWFDETIKPLLERDYPEDLAEKTYSFMNIDEHVNEWITNKDWSHLDDHVPYNEHKKMLDSVCEKISPSRAVLDVALGELSETEALSI